MVKPIIVKHGWIAPIQSFWAALYDLSIPQLFAHWRRGIAYVFPHLMVYKIVRLPEGLAAKDCALYVQHHYPALLGWHDATLSYAMLPCSNQRDPDHHDVALWGIAQATLKDLHQQAQQQKIKIKSVVCGWQLWMHATMVWILKNNRGHHYHFVAHMTQNGALCFGFYQKDLIWMDYQTQLQDCKWLETHWHHYTSRIPVQSHAMFFITQESKTTVVSLPISEQDNLEWHWFSVGDPILTMPFTDALVKTMFGNH